MYLRGSQWSMNRRRKPLNYLNIFLLLVLVGISLYFAPLASTVETPWNPTPTPTRSPESYLTEAEQLFSQGKLTQSIDAYREAVKSDPKNASAYIAMARVQVWAGQYKDAQASAENALLLNQNNSTAHAVRGWALSNQGDFLNAEASIKRALDIDPNNALAHAYYAELLVDEFFNNQGGLDIVDRMSEESKVALSLGNNTVEAHRARGYVLEATGNYEEAVREYQAATAINNNLADLYLSLGRAYRALGIYDQAVDSLSRANALNPADPTPELLISRIYYVTGEYAKAEQYAQQSLKDSPGDANLHGNLGLMYYKNFKYPDAVSELTLTIKGGSTSDGLSITPIDLVPDSPRVAEYYFTYGLALAKLTPPQCAQALPIAQQILSKLPGDEISVYNANEIIRICSEAAGTPAATETPTQAVTPTP